MPEEPVVENKNNIAVVKSTRKTNIFSKFRDKLPQNNKKLLALLLIVLVIPITVGLALVQQDPRSHASEGDRKMVMGISNTQGVISRDANVEAEIASINDLKTQTGQYPGSYSIWTRFAGDQNGMRRTTFPSSTLLNFLDGNNITPVIFMESTGDDIERGDGKFSFSDITDPAGISTGQIRFDNSSPSLITKIYIFKTGALIKPGVYFWPGQVTSLVNSWVNGSKITIYDSAGPGGGSLSYNDPRFVFTVGSGGVIDSGTYYTINVTNNQSKGLPTPGAVIWPGMADTKAKKFSNASIAAGSFDDYLKAWANGAKAYGKPVILRYDQEMNGSWFAWGSGGKDKNGNLTGQPTTQIPDGSGRYRYFNEGNTPQNFIASWKHIYNVVHRIAPNVKFFWCPFNGDFKDYFPGKDYVDYIGFDAYMWSGRPYQSMADIYGGPVTKLRKLPIPLNSDGTSKIPMIVGETGIANTFTSAQRNDWIGKGYPSVYNQYPDIKGILYFDIDASSGGEPNWMLTADPEMMSTYTMLSNDPRFKGRFTHGSVPSPTGNPSLTPSPTPAPDQPFGFHDSASCTVMTGWTCDESSYGNPVKVELYDGPKEDGADLGGGTADKARSDVSAECGGTINHGFSLTTPNNVKDGNVHEIWVYPINVDGSISDNELTASPKEIVCTGTGPSPSSTPEPTGCVRNNPTITYGDTNKSGKPGETVIYKVSVKDNDSTSCPYRKVTFTLSLPSYFTRWTYLPKILTINPNETKTVNFKITSGRYAKPGIKSLSLIIKGRYKPFKVFSSKILQYNVTP